MTTTPDAPVVEPVNGSAPVLAPLTIFSAATVTAVTESKLRRKAKAKRSVAASARSAARTVWSDLGDAWFWDAAPPKLPEVWRAWRVSYDKVPMDEHRCLHIEKEHPGMVFAADGPLGACRCPGRSEKERGEFTRANRLRIAWRWGWILWNLIVAIPATMVLYPLAWILQHPARSFLGFSTIAFLWGVTQSLAESAR